MHGKLTLDQDALRNGLNEFAATILTLRISNWDPNQSISHATKHQSWYQIYNCEMNRINLIPIHSECMCSLTLLQNAACHGVTQIIYVTQWLAPLIRKFMPEFSMKGFPKRIKNLWKGYTFLAPGYPWKGSKFWGKVHEWQHFLSTCILSRTFRKIGKFKHSDRYGLRWKIQRYKSLVIRSHELCQLLQTSISGPTGEICLSLLNSKK